MWIIEWLRKRAHSGDRQGKKRCPHQKFHNGENLFVPRSSAKKRLVEKFDGL
jgi:hypothetical protein